jgi:hypothetical protein
MSMDGMDMSFYSKLGGLDASSKIKSPQRASVRYPPQSIVAVVDSDIKDKGKFSLPPPSCLSRYLNRIKDTESHFLTSAKRIDGR